MTPHPLSHDSRPMLAPLYRLQFESAQDRWVLLYPEGMVRLNGSASEVLRRCDGQLSVHELVAGLERDFDHPDVRTEAVQFLCDAHGRGWIV
jgi:pyrroloquinoline quinone biosynthesis protein D